MPETSAFCPVRWLVIAADHPALPGHFPGQPIVPGVVLLDCLLALVEAERPGAAVAGIPVAKFLKVARPGECLLLGLDPVSAEQVRFICCIDGHVAARGVLNMSQSA